MNTSPVAWHSKHLGALALASLVFFVYTPLVYAQSSMSVSITPPLFQLTIGPGESWSSSVKVVNTNQQEMTYYAQAVDFEAQGESGNASLAPLALGSHDPTHNAFSLASWITLPQEPVTVPAGSSAEIPFTVQVPENAEPGGHYGAILIGTQPPPRSQSGTLVKVSSYVSSLLFVRIKGEIIESGRIREFTSDQELYQSPEAAFTLRFENTGNTHVKPEGNITIYNMWGKERGSVDINQDSGNFGNVLPKSIRKFQFSWTADRDPFDIGLYRAVVTLAFGDGGKQNISATTYFWVVPVVPVVVGVLTFLALALLIGWLIRRYIRRALSLEKERLVLADPVFEAPKPASTAQTLMKPLREGVVDLRALAGKAAPSSAPEAPREAAVARVQKVSISKPSFTDLLKKYKLFLLFVATVAITCVVLLRYFDQVLVAQRHFEIKDVKIQEEQAQTK